MIEDKYYTPEIEEFHVGFEYELKWKKEDWVKEILSEASSLIRIKDIINNQSNFQIRVKYLDKEDIESFEWVYTGTTIDNWYELIVTRPAPLSNYVNRRFVMQHDFRTNQGVIIRGYEFESGNSGEETLYRGSCKNKSELKRLMKQLGI